MVAAEAVVVAVILAVAGLAAAVDLAEVAAEIRTNS